MSAAAALIPFSHSRRLLEELMRPKRILLVEDDELWREVMLRSMEEYHQVTTIATDGLKACALVEENDYDSIILDLNLPGVPGMDVFRYIRLRNPTVRVAIVSAYFDAKTWSALNKIGFCCHIEKCSGYDSTFFEALMVALAVEKKTD